MCKMSKTAAFYAARNSRVGRAIWQEIFGPSWGEADVSDLNERGMQDIGMIRTRYGISADDMIAPDPSARSLH